MGPVLLLLVAAAVFAVIVWAALGQHLTQRANLEAVARRYRGVRLESWLSD